MLKVTQLVRDGSGTRTQAFWCKVHATLLEKGAHRCPWERAHSDRQGEDAEGGRDQGGERQEGEGGRKSQRGAPHSERETGAQMLWVDGETRSQVGTAWPLSKQVPPRTKSGEKPRDAQP